MDMQEEGNDSFNGDVNSSHPGSGNTNSSTVNPSPFALHVENKKNEKQTNDTDKQDTSQKPHNLRAPYAQPVLDASKLGSSKRSSVDERIALVRERRLQHQHALEQEAQMRRAKDDAAYTKWEQTQEERRRKMDENREKEETRRKDVEMRKRQRLDEEKKRAEAIVARTEQQATVVLRQKRTASVDRTKRWSWGAGGYGGGGGGGITYATAVETAPGPFHYFDPTRMTKHIRGSGLGRACRPKSMTASNLDLSQFMTGDAEQPSGNTGSGPVGYGSPTAVGNMQRDDKFSKSPLLMGTAHMAFASGLRSYDSSPVSNTSKQSSPATTPRSGRARSSDTRTKSRTRNSSVNTDGPAKKPSTRGRSPAARRTESVKKSKATTSPQLTEPTHLSARLLAPTKASMARSKQGDGKQDDSVSSPTIGPVRSRSNDRRPTRDRPSSAKSDSSSASSSNNLSPRAPISTTPKSRPMGRTPSPSLYKPRSATQKTPTLQSSSSPNLSQRSRGQSPQLRTTVPRRAPSPAAKTPDASLNKSNKPASRGTSPARQPSPSATGRTSSGSKRTPVRDVKPQPSKSTPPAIKQPLKKGITLGKTKSPALQSKVKSAVKKDEKADVQPAETKVQTAPVESTASNEPTEDVSSTNLQPNVAEPNVETATVNKEEPSANVIEIQEQIVANATPAATESEKVNQKEVIADDEPNVKEPTEVESAQENVVSTENVDIPVVEEEKDLHQNVSDNTVDDVTEKTSPEQSLQAEIENVQLIESEPTPEKVPEVATDMTSTSNEQQAHNEGPAEEIHTEEIAVVTEDLQNVAEGNVSEQKEICTEVSKPTNEQPEPEPVQVVTPEPETEDAVPENLTAENPLPEEGPSKRDEEKEAVVTVVEKSEIEEPEKIVEMEGEDTPQKEEVRQSVEDMPTVVVSDANNVELHPSEDQSQLAEDNKEESTDQQTELCTPEQVTPSSDLAPTPAPHSDPTPESSDSTPASSNSTADPIPDPAPIKETKSVPEPVPVPESKKKEKKLTPEEQAYKEAMAAKRREAKEKREREEQERQERKRLEAEERARRVEIARKMAEEAKLEEEQRLMEEKRIQEEEELKKKQEAEEMARKHEEFIREQKEKVEQKAKEEAEKVRKERNLVAQKKEEERLQRKKRLEMIMRRTRGGESPTPPDTSPSNTTPSGDSSPANITPTGGRSPYNSVTPDRMVSPATVEMPPLSTQEPATESAPASENHEETPSVSETTSTAEVMTPLSRDASADDVTESDEPGVPTLVLPDEDASMGTEIKSQMPEPLLAFVEGVNGDAESNTFVPVKEQNGRAFDPVDSGEGKVALNGSNPFVGEEGFAEQQYAKMQEVPTGNLLEF